MSMLPWIYYLCIVSNFFSPISMGNWVFYTYSRNRGIFQLVKEFASFVHFLPAFFAMYWCKFAIFRRNTMKMAYPSVCYKFALRVKNSQIPTSVQYSQYVTL